MSINNRDDANKYYQIINDLIDNYIDKWKIRPRNLKTYLKFGSDKLERFIVRNGLKDIKGINQIIKDVIDDRVSMEEDGVLTFESFKVFESSEFKVATIIECFTKGIDKVDINMEKFLADEFDTSLSHVDIVDSDKHIFTIDNWGKSRIDVLIYSKEEFDIIKSNLREYFVNQYKGKVMDIYGVKVSLIDITDVDKFNSVMSEKIDEEKAISILTQALKKEGKNLEFKSNGNYYYWIISEI